MDKENVISFPSKRPLFNHELRQRLEQGVQGFTQQPVETVTTVEQIICSYLVLGARRIAENLGKKLGERIMNKVAANE